MGVTNKDQCREAFEAWARSLPEGVNLTREGSGYRYAYAECFWEAWQAARSVPAAPVELPEPTYTLRVRSVFQDPAPTAQAFGMLDGEYNLFTEQQVRELLAAARRGCEAAENLPETRMDTGADRGGGVLPEPAIDLPRAGAEALKEYFQFCKEQSILPDVGGAFAYAIRAGAKIAAAPKLPQGDGWLPIESAPKDKTILLGYRNTHGNWRTLRGEWFSREEIDEFWEDPDGVEPGWFETSVEADDVPNVWRTEPTHWMPLPHPPKEQG